MRTQKTLTVEKQPQSVEEFLSLREKIGYNPEGGAVMFLLALKTYVENPQLGKQFLVLSVAKNRLVPGDFYKGYALNRNDMYLADRLEKYPYVPYSYISGTTPENNYQASEPFTYTIIFQDNSGDPQTDKYVKIFIVSSGADTARPVTLEKNNKGLWKVSEFSSLVVGVRPPVSSAEEDDEL